MFSPIRVNHMMRAEPPAALLLRWCCRRWHYSPGSGAIAHFLAIPYACMHALSVNSFTPLYAYAGHAPAVGKRHGCELPRHHQQRHPRRLAPPTSSKRMVVLTALLLPGLGFVWPLVETCRVLTGTKQDDEQGQEEQEQRALLAYWTVVLLGRLLLERPFDACVGGGAAGVWIKLALVLWLVWPPRRFHGAAVVHAHVLQPLLAGHEAAIDRQLAGVASQARATARRAVAVAGRSLAATCLPEGALDDRKGMSSALAWMETARAFWGPILAAAGGKEKEEVDIE